jgi:hypothetical protein
MEVAFEAGLRDALEYKLWLSYEVDEFPLFPMAERIKGEKLCGLVPGRGCFSAWGIDDPER